MPHTICVRKGEKTRIFVATICFGQNFFGPKQCKAGSAIKIGVSAEIAKKTKMTPFLWKRCVLTWLKKWVLLTVFLKSCVSWKHYFYSVFSKAQFFKNINCMLKKQKIYEKLWVVFEHGKMVFFGGLFFWGVNIKRFVFGMSGFVSKVFKMLVFPSFGVFLGWLIVVHLGLDGLGVFVFLVFVFPFCVAFVSVLFALFVVLWLDVVVLLFLLFFLFCFLEGLRVRWGGPKGHLTWP